jgi:hypothetical protein
VTRPPLLANVTITVTSSAAVNGTTIHFSLTPRVVALPLTCAVQETLRNLSKRDSATTAAIVRRCDPPTIVITTVDVLATASTPTTNTIIATISSTRVKPDRRRTASERLGEA